MPKVTFAAHVQRHVPVPEMTVDAATLKVALNQVFAAYPAVKDYIVDEQGSLRKHVTIYFDGERVRDRMHLSDAVRADSHIYVLQALSGG